MFVQLCHRFATTTPTNDSTARPGWLALATITVGAMVATCVAIATPTSAHADGNVGGFLSHLNSVRAHDGLPALSLDGELTAVAQAHTHTMAANGTISHNPALRSQVTNWQTLGENVGMGSSVSSIDNAFDASPGHYANEINTTYTDVGIGSVTSGGTIYVTLDFRRPTHPTSAPHLPAQAPKTTRATPQAATQAAHAAARTAAAEQTAALTSQLRTSDDPVARALVFSAHINTTGQNS